MIAPAAQGEVVSVWSSVVDVRFPQGNPPLHHQLLAGERGQVVIEVLTHLDQERIRGIALTPTQGLARGDLVMDTGHPLRVPVGERLLGRVLNVLGETTGGLEGLAGGEWRPILQPTVPLAQQVTRSELPIVETEAQNISAYIPTNLISITDGQIYLSPVLFQRGVLPAVDIERGRRSREILKQPQYQPMSVAEQISVLLALTAGLLDEIPLEGIAAAETTIRRAALAELPDLCRAIEAGASLEEDDRQALLSVVREALRLEFGRQSDGNPGDPETQD